MRKLYETYLYQVSPKKGYLENGKEYSSFIPTVTISNGEFVRTEESTLQKKKKLIIEVISPFLAREIKTGIIFPIAKINVDEHTHSHMSMCCKGKIHTFILGKESNKEFAEVTTDSKLEEYYEQSPDAETLKRELLGIFAIGKKNMEAKIFGERQIQQLQRERKRKECMEKRKVKKLTRQFRQERRKI